MYPQMRLDVTRYGPRASSIHPWSRSRPPQLAIPPPLVDLVTDDRALPPRGFPLCYLYQRYALDFCLASPLSSLPFLVVAVPFVVELLLSRSFHSSNRSPLLLVVDVP
jgi:hypothetical protein